MMETILRLFGYQPTLSHAFYLHTPWRVLDNDLIMIHPDFRREDYYKIAADLPVIVTLGDSFTAGFPVSRGHAYPAVLKEELKDYDLDFNVINMGLGHSGTDQQMRLFKIHVLNNVTPDIVLWEFYTNDIDDNVRQSVYTVRGDKLVERNVEDHWLYKRQRFYAWLPEWSKDRSRLVLLMLHIWELYALLQQDREDDAMSRSWALRKIRLAIMEMNRLADLFGFEVYYILIAPQSMYLAETDSAYWKNDSTLPDYQELYKIFGRECNFIEAWFGGAGRSNPKGSLPDAEGIFASGIRDASRLGNRHFNEKGYRLLAEAVAGRLLADRAIVPPSTSRTSGPANTERTPRRTGRGSDLGRELAPPGAARCAGRTSVAGSVRHASRRDCRDGIRPV